MMVMAIAVVVTMAATGEKDGYFDMVTARSADVTNDAGDLVVGLGVNDGGNGLVMTKSAQGKGLVRLSSTAQGDEVEAGNKLIRRDGTCSSS